MGGEIGLMEINAGGEAFFVSPFFYNQNSDKRYIIVIEFLSFLYR